MDRNELEKLILDSPFHELLDLRLLEFDQESGTLELEMPFNPAVERGHNSGQFHGGIIASFIEYELPVTCDNRCKDKSIILVGNSGALHGSKKGKLIDDYDVIIRMNHGVPGEWENDVGTRTDMWFFSYHYMGSQVSEYHAFNPKFIIRSLL